MKKERAVGMKDCGHTLQRVPGSNSRATGALPSDKQGVLRQTKDLFPGGSGAQSRKCI